MPEPLTDTSSAAPQAAASVLMVRDGEAGLEVYLLRRHERSSVLGGAWVFPGGKVDAADADPLLRAHIDLSPDELQARLGEAELNPTEAAALHVAAAREVFEECGVLFAHGPAAQLPLQAARDGDFGALLRTHGLRLNTGTLRPWSRWVTPAQALFVKTRRFDTRFFIAALPGGQQAVPDAHEAVDGRWFTPRDALGQYWAGQVLLVPPQLMSLAHLAGYTDTATLLAAAAVRQPHCVRPEVFEHAGARAIAYPGDPLHPQPERVMPGPLRLLQRGERMEPPGGFAEFCDWATQTDRVGSRAGASA